MPLQPNHLLSRPFPSIEHAYSLRDTQLYALGLGLGADPLDAGQLRYVYEGKDGASLRALPTMANVLADECLKLCPFLRKEQRCARNVFLVVRVIDLAISRMVVEVGARLHRHLAILYGSVEVLEIGGV